MIDQLSLLPSSRIKEPWPSKVNQQTQQTLLIIVDVPPHSCCFVLFYKSNPWV